MKFWCSFAGGKKFCTTIDTLTNREPDSMLAAMFSGRHAMSNESKTVLSAFFCYFNFISQASSEF